MLFKQLFCKHKFKIYKTAKSRRVGYDNHVMGMTRIECEKCNEYHIIEVIDKIEKNWYLEEELKALGKRSENIRF